MLKPAFPPRPVDLLRASSDQIRRAAELLADITDDTAVDRAGRFATLFPGQMTAEVEEREITRQATIVQAQRSFASALRLSQVREDPSE